MILGFDIGNTNTLMGIYDDNGIKPKHTFMYGTQKEVSCENLGSLIEGFVADYRTETGSQDAVTGFVFSSVAPEINPQYHDAAMTFFNVEAMEISHESRLSITIRYDNPAALGVDRIVNAEAAYREYGGNAIIIDLGTAVTFCVLLDDGTFDGGLIAPGIGTTIRALSQRASKLPEIIFEKPADLVLPGNGRFAFGMPEMRKYLRGSWGPDQWDEPGRPFVPLGPGKKAGIRFDASPKLKRIVLGLGATVEGQKVTLSANNQVVDTYTLEPVGERSILVVDPVPPADADGRLQITLEVDKQNDEGIGLRLFSINLATSRT